MLNVIIIFLALSLGTAIAIPWGSVSYNLQYVQIVILIYFVLICLKKASRNQPFTMANADRRHWFLWLICFIYSLFTAGLASQPITALSGSISLFFVLIAVVTANHVLHDDPDIFITANRLFILSLFLQLAVNMFQISQTHGLSLYVLKSYSNTAIGNSNTISFYFTFAMFFELIAREKKWIIFTLMSAVGVVYTISRGAIVTIIICVIVLLLINPRLKGNQKKKLVLSVLFVFAVMVAFLLFTVPGQVFLKNSENLLHSSAVSSRLYRWRDSIQQTLDNPLGNGIIWRNDPHNTILRAFKDLGIFIGPIFVFLVIYPFLLALKKGLKKLNQKALAVLIGYLSIFVHSMIDVFYISTTHLIYIVFIMAYFYYIIEHRPESLVERTANEYE